MRSGREGQSECGSAQEREKAKEWNGKSMEIKELEEWEEKGWKNGYKSSVI